MAAKKIIKKKTIETSKKKETMADLLAKYGSSKAFTKGDQVKGKVIEKRKDALVLDIGGKCEGLVKGAVFDESKGFIKHLEVGDEIEGRVIVTETPEGFAIISLRNAATDASWKKLQEAKEKNKEISAVGKSVNSSGVLVEVAGLTGFVPHSHISKAKAKDTSKLIDKKMKVKILEVDRDANKIVLSERAVSEAGEIEKAQKAIDLVKVGELLKGKVTGTVDFGCFVEVSIPFGKGKDKVKVEGLVHVSEMAWHKVDRPSDMVKVGQEVDVKVIGSESGKLALSMKQAEKDPWEDVEKKYQKDVRVKGKVTKLSDFGVFVEVEPGVEGLIHITRIPPNKKLKVGDEVSAYVDSVDKKERRLSLGLVLTTKPVGYK